MYHTHGQGCAVLVGRPHQGELVFTQLTAIGLYLTSQRAVSFWCKIVEVMGYCEVEVVPPCLSSFGMQSIGFRLFFQHKPAEVTLQTVENSPVLWHVFLLKCHYYVFIRETFKEEPMIKEMEMSQTALCGHCTCMCISNRISYCTSWEQKI